MADHDGLAEQFERRRAQLKAMAYRMLGSHAEAEDAVQDAWLRVSRADADAVQNIGGWLTTIVGRVCLDMLRSRKARREDVLDLDHDDRDVTDDAAPDPEHDALLADSMGLALLLVLDALTPAERIAFVLHDMFDLSFDDIGPIVGRSSTAARQLASRARRRVRGTTPAQPDRDRQREVVDAFLSASRTGDMTALLALLDPDVVLRADAVAVATSAARQAYGAPSLAPEIHGAAAVAEAFAGRARAAQRAVIDGLAGAAWVQGGQARAVFRFATSDGRITGIEIILDPQELQHLHIEL